MSQRDEILARIKQIPELPTVITKIVRLMRVPDFKISELEQHISYSPSLAANVLRMANSAYYAGPRTISSIREAVVRLGSKTINDLVIASAVAPMARQEIKGYGLSPNALWEHMVATAIATEQMAKFLKIRLPGYAFTAALLHDVGKIVLGTSIAVDPEPIMKLAFEEHVPFEQAELRILGIDHTEAGAFLLESWELPQDIIDVVRWHHDPQSSPRPSQVLDFVHVANSLTMMSGVGRGEDGLNYRPSPEVMGRLRLRIGHLEKILYETMKGLDEVKAFFVSTPERK